MKNLSFIALFVLALSGCSSQQVAAPVSCSASQFHIDYDFDNARVNDCQVVRDNHIVITITPENSPINNSAWYAFKASSLTQKQVNVTINYQGGDHRYAPKLSADGKEWQALEHQSSKDSLQFSLNLSATPVYVAGQEIITNDDYQTWLAKKGQQSHVNFSVLGQSTQGRDIGMLEITQPKNKEWLVVLGRMHPPEVTGALALFPFVEQLLEEGAAAAAFRGRFNILVVPNLNPDGVAMGNWRHNANGVDLNRDWKSFKQVETQLVRDKLNSIVASGERLVFALDFHSTHRDIFYTMPSDYGLNPPHLVENWLNGLASTVAPFVVEQKPGNNPDKGVFKQYIADIFSVHAITYEMGDSTERRTIKAIAQHASDALMTTLLSTPSADFVVTK